MRWATIGGKFNLIYHSFRINCLFHKVLQRRCTFAGCAAYDTPQRSRFAPPNPHTVYIYAKPHLSAPCTHWHHVCPPFPRRHNKGAAHTRSSGSVGHSQMQPSSLRCPVFATPINKRTGTQRQPESTTMPHQLSATVRGHTAPLGLAGRTLARHGPRGA